MDVINNFSKTETFMTEDTNMSLAMGDLVDEMSSLDTIPSRLSFPASEVPVASFDEGTTVSKYGVGADVLSLYMERNGISDIKEAMSNIASANNISVEEMMMVLPSDAEVIAYMNEAKQDPNPTSKKEKMDALAQITRVIKVGKDGEVNMAKEPPPNPVTQIQWNDNESIINIDTDGSGHYPDERPTTW
jgi:hypothetical protein